MKNHQLDWVISYLLFPKYICITTFWQKNILFFLWQNPCPHALLLYTLRVCMPKALSQYWLRHSKRGKRGKEGGEERLPSPSFLHEGNFLMSSRIIKVKMDTRWVSNRGNSRCVSLEVISQKPSVSDLSFGGKKNQTVFFSILKLGVLFSAGIIRENKSNLAVYQKYFPLGSGPRYTILHIGVCLSSLACFHAVIRTNNIISLRIREKREIPIANMGKGGRRGQRCQSIIMRSYDYDLSFFLSFFFGGRENGICLVSGLLSIWHKKVHNGTSYHTGWEKGVGGAKKRLFEERSNHYRSGPFFIFLSFPGQSGQKKGLKVFSFCKEWKRKSCFITSASSAFNDKEGFYRRKEKSLWIVSKENSSLLTREDMGG